MVTENARTRTWEGSLLSGTDRPPSAATLIFRRPVPASGHMSGRLESWRGDLRDTVLAMVSDFVRNRCALALQGTGVDIVSDVLIKFVDGGKCLRSTFMYLGWLCGADDDTAALRAAASLELLHAFALLQDDVMDGSALRRGQPSAHAQFATWHRARRLSGSPDRFGESAAVLLGDLCLVWAEQMLRESGVEGAALSRAWPRYDAMRTELAVGQFADLVNDARRFPPLDEVLDVSRRKSGNYTVRRPLEIGAALAGCSDGVLAALGGYGEAIGEAFQLRDDLLGIFGSPSVTGKPAGGDLSERKATSVVVAAHHLADSTLRRQLGELMTRSELDENRCRSLAEPDRRNRGGGVDRADDRRAVQPRARLDPCRRHRRIGPDGLGRHGHRLRRASRMNTDRVVVVGAGLAGLSAALHLAGRGRAVTVIERGQHPGGRVGRLDVGGYRLDTGPTVLTMPDIIDDAFAAVGESTTDRLELTPVTPAYRASFADGSALDVHTDPDTMAAEIERFAGRRQADGYLRLRNWLTRLYDVEFDGFIAANFDSPLSLLTPQLARLAAMGGFRRWDPMVRRFVTDERLRRIFTFQALYAGVPPQRALAVYAVIAYMDTIAGVYFPRGGMRALPDALAAAAADAGVEFQYGSAVSALEHSGDRVIAVRTDTGDRIPAGSVVLTTELPDTYRLLGRTPRRLLRLRPAPSAVVAHVGCKAAADDIAHHTIVFGQAWDQTFRDIIDDGRLMSDPSLLVTRPTAATSAWRRPAVTCSTSLRRPRIPLWEKLIGRRSAAHTPSTC